MNNTHHIGRIIRNHREEKKYTLEYTAELCGMSDRGLAKIELGELSVCIPTEIEDHLAG